MTNYIEIINEFWTKDRSNPFENVDTKLYFLLLDESNIRQWANPIALHTYNLEARLRIRRKAIGDARNRLKQRGLIDFHAKTNNPTIYLIKGAEITNPEYSQLFLQGNNSETIRKQSGNNDETIGKHNNINYKTIKPKTENRFVVVDGFPDVTREGVVERFIGGRQITLDQFCKNESVSLDQFREIMKEVLTDWQMQGWELRDIVDGKGDYSTGHLLNAMRVKKQKRLDAISVRMQKERFLQESADPEYRGCLEWIDRELPYVAAHMAPLSEQEYRGLVAAYGKTKVRKNIQNLENRQDLRGNYTSLYRTLLNWCKNGYND